MGSRELYYNISDTLHTAKLEKTLHKNAMSEEQADQVEFFLESLKEGTPLEGDLPVRLVCIQGDAGTGKTQSIVSLCSILPCPIVVGSTNPCSVNVAQRCKSAFPYSSCVQAQLSGTAWSALRWNIDTEKIGQRWEAAIYNIYAKCVSTKSAPTVEQDREIYRLLNKSLFPKMRERFTAESHKPPRNKIYGAWNAARTGSRSFSSNEKATTQLYEMFCSIPQDKMTQEDFNAALAFRTITAFTEALPRPLLSNFLVMEEAARLPAYFFRIATYYHYMIRFALKPPGYRDSMLTICFMGSPLQSKVIRFPDFSVMDEAVMDAQRRNTHVSIYTVNRRTGCNSLKAAGLATVVHVLENDCPLQQEHCRLLDSFRVPENSFMDPTFAPSAMRLTHYHKRAIEFTNMANCLEQNVVTFYEYVLISEGVNPVDPDDSTIRFLSKHGAARLPYRNTRAKDVKREAVCQLDLGGPILTVSDDGAVRYSIACIKRTLGKNTPVTIQHTTRLIPVEFTGTYHTFHNSDALSHSCQEQVWSLRIGLSFASMLCRTLSERESYSLLMVIDDVWTNAYRCGQDISLCSVDDVEQRASISACLTEAHDALWDTVVHADKVGFVDLELRVEPFSEGGMHTFPDVILRGDRFPNTLMLEDVVQLTSSDFPPHGRISWKHLPYASAYKLTVCRQILRAIQKAVSKGAMELHDLLLMAPSGILFRTVNVVIPDRWSAVFPMREFEWKSVAVRSEDEDGDNMEPVTTKAKKTMVPGKAAGGSMDDATTPPSHSGSSEGGMEDAHDGDDADYEDEDDEEVCREEATSLVHMLHTVYDSRVRTIDSVQGDTITCGTLVDVQSIGSMGQLTVALTRNTDADNLMLTSSAITHIPTRNPITKFVRLSARDTDCYYVK